MKNHIPPAAEDNKKPQVLAAEDNKKPQEFLIIKCYMESK